MGVGWVGGAIVAGTVLKGVGEYTSAKAERDAQRGVADAQRAAASQTEAYALEELEAFEARRDEWESLYGNVEKNLAQSIQKLDERSFEVRGHTELEKQYTDISRRMSESFAARGIAGGIPSSAELGNLRSLARDKAMVSANAPIQSADAQSNLFLRLGLATKPNEDAATQRYYNRLGGATDQNVNAAVSLGNAEIAGGNAIGGALSNTGSLIGQVAGQYGGALGSIGSQTTMGMNPAVSTNQASQWENSAHWDSMWG